MKRFALNLSHLTLPEVIDFKALGDAGCVKLNAKRPLTGFLAILLTETGTFGKIFLEALENVDREQIEGVTSMVAKQNQRYLCDVLLKRTPVLICQTLYSLESNTRSATITDAVTVGGIGLLPNQAIIIPKDREEVSYYIVLIVILVTAMDTFSGWFRWKLIPGGDGEKGKMARWKADVPFIHPDCDVSDTHFGEFVEIERGTRIAHSSMGDCSYYDRFSDIANADIGKFANIASYVRIGATDHPMDKASQHHFHNRSADYFDDASHDEAWFAHRRSCKAHIGHDTWIGHNAQIKPEVTIGDGAVVSGGAIVTKDVAPYMIVAGIPAKPLHERYPPSVAERMIALAWWDWPHDRLRSALEDFRTLKAEAFLERYE